ncbi:MAG: N-acetylmuramoyl-L-alanine amidase [Alphaproteobacteria bacterium]|nr:N-acetylmuramoyl-L-alanine amidase [Alphaproteobacteria bacterium]
MQRRSSPNYDERAEKIALAYIVLHYTGMKSGEEALARLCDPMGKVSAHYVVGEDGVITQMVDEERRAWHAGKSFWRGLTDINSASIGIELINPGHEFGYRAFPAAQIAALKGLLRGVIARHGMDAARCLLGHSDIAPARKEDPGELFPWRELAAEGFGVWPEPAPPDYAAAGGAEALLEAIGYDITRTDKALLAFQRRFYPERLGKGVDTETIARMRAVNRLLNV